jgi:hypothetical protein
LTHQPSLDTSGFAFVGFWLSIAPSKKMAGKSNVCCFLVVLGILVGVALVVTIPLVAVYGRSGSLYTAVNVGSIQQHLSRFEAIAVANGNNRGPLGNGFNESVAYVTQILVSVGFSPTRQSFAFGYFEPVTPPVLIVDG